MSSISEAARDETPMVEGCLLDAHAVVLLIADQNDRDDPWEGLVPMHVERFARYRCGHLTIAEIDLEGHGYDPQLAEEYSRTPARRFPPVVYDPIDRTLIDGYHRTYGAILRGECTIYALVGIREDADPDWHRPEF